MDDFINKNYKFKSQVWIFDGPTPWYFVTLPKEMSKEIDFFFEDSKRGWGSLPVRVTVGETEWKTSIFASKQLDSYILPIKAEVRKKENIDKDDFVEFEIEIRV
jgi:hypothetical protein